VFIVPSELESGTCKRCQRPLLEIDHYGERLIGCGAGGAAGAYSWSCQRMICAHFNK
jgi:hypothetical protein